MSAKTRPFEQFGPYILFKKLESDALGELWRAGRIEDRHLGPIVALRRLTGGNREALAQSASEAREIVPMLTGTSFAKEQTIDVVNGVACIAHAYDGGRSLRHIIDRARGGAGMTPNPVPVDQAIAVAEKVALSLATTAELRQGGTRLAHGGLIPQFVWVSEDGEVRVAGQRLGKGLIASLKDGKVAAAIGRYFSPEYQLSGEPSPSSEIYSVGAILFLLLTGNEPPDALHVSAFSQSIRASKMMSGEAMPDDIRTILEKSLSIDTSRRYASIGDMKAALSALAHGGKYSATTFNLAFYLSGLLKKEMDSESFDREKESKVNIVPYLEQQVTLASPPIPLPAAEKTQKSKTPLIAAAAVVVLAIAGTTFWAMQRKSAPLPAKPAPKPVAAQAKKPAPVQSIVAAAVVTPAATPSTATTASVDPAAEKKAFEAAVNQKLQEEMAKLQADFNKQLQQKKSRPQEAAPPVQTASAAPQHPEQVADDRAPSAASLDERRLASQQQAPPPQLTQSSAPVTSATAQVQQQPEAQPQVQPAAPATKEGDLVDFNDLDERPQVVSRPQLMYPPMALRQHIQTSLILTVLISESGNVLDVRILRGDNRFGFNDEALRLLRSTRYRPAMKDGKHVKTWMPQPVEFRLQ